jgi:hypothetical protein
MSVLFHCILMISWLMEDFDSILPNDTPEVRMYEVHTIGVQRVGSVKFEATQVIGTASAVNGKFLHFFL